MREEKKFGERTSDIEIKIAIQRVVVSRITQEKNLVGKLSVPFIF